MDTRIILIISAAIFVIVVLFFLFDFALKYQKRNGEFEIEKQQLQSQFSQTLLQTQLEIQEQTLKTISQEIHDNVGQVLTLAKLNLATTSVEDHQVSEKIKTTQQLIAKAIQDLRDLSRSLNTDYVEEMGLVRSVEYELDMLKKTGTIETEFSITGKVLRLDKQKELILFRIVQEAIHNTVKHAAAKKITAHMQFSENELSISIADDGKGFDLNPLKDEANQSFGLGLRNMKNRATLMGAKFLMNSNIGNGTEVYISLPLNGDINERTDKN
jgi:two-component system, NarL family, sensor kinase